MKKNLHFSSVSPSGISNSLVNNYYSYMKKNLFKAIKYSLLLMVCLVFGKVTNAQIIEGFEETAWATNATNTSTSTIESTTNAVSAQYSTGPAKNTFTFAVAMTGNAVWGTSTNFSTSNAVFSSGTAASPASSSTGSTTAVSGASTAFTMQITSKWSSSNLYTYYSAKSVASGISSVTYGTGTNTSSSTWAYSGAAIVASSNILTNAANYVKTGNNAILLDASLKGFIITPYLSGGITTVTLNVFTSTAGSDLEILANSNSAITGNTGSMTKTVSTNAINNTNTTASVSGSWSGSYYGTITGNLSTTATTGLQSLTNPGGWQQITFTTSIASGQAAYLKIQNLGGGKDIFIDDITITQPAQAPTRETVSGTSTICNGGSATITLHPSQTGVTYQLLANGVTSGSPIVGSTKTVPGDTSWTVSPSTTTTYKVVTTTANNYAIDTMTGSAVITVNTKATNPTGISAGSTTINYGDSTTITLSGGGTGTGGSTHWFTGGCKTTDIGKTGNGIYVSPLGTTTYYGAYLDGTPCSDTTTCQSVKITVDTLAPTVTTAAISNLLSTSASTGGNVSTDGGSAITERGVVYSTSSNPTTSDTKVKASGTTGSFTSSLSGLTPGQGYHVRAYAINGIGTSYGADVSFTTSNVPTISFTSSAGTNGQTVYRTNSITNITYAWGGTASTASVTWTGTTGSSTPPTGISVSNSSSPLTISGTPTVAGSYGYTVTTDGTPAATATGTLVVTEIPTVTLAAISAISAGNVFTSSTNNILTNFSIGIADSNASFTAVRFPFSVSGLVAADITNFKIYSTSGSSFTSPTQLASVTPTSTNITNGYVDFTFSQSITTGHSGYFWVTADIASAATTTHSITPGSIPTTNLTFSTIFASSSSAVAASGAQTITNPVYYNVSGSDVSVLTNWGSNTDGSGNHPANFTTANTTYNLFNGTSNTVGANTTISGSGVNFTVGDSSHAASIKVNALDTLIFSGSNTVSVSPLGTLSVAATGDLTLTSTAMILRQNSTVTVNGYLKNTGSIATQYPTTVPTPAAVTFSGSGSTYEHNIDGGTIPTATWSTGATTLITGSTGNAPSGNDQAFYHFTWNCPSQNTDLPLAIAGSTGSQHFAGNFTVTNTGLTHFLRSFSMSTGQQRALTIDGNFVIDTAAMFTSNGSSNKGYASFNIGGDFKVNAGVVNKGAFYFSKASANKSSCVVNLTGGNFINNGLVSSANATDSAAIIFSKTGTQTYTNSGTFTSTLTATSITVNSGDTLDVASQVIGGALIFNLNSGATLKTAHASGINGNLTTTGAKTLLPTANYIFNGSAAQASGALLTAANNLYIANTSASSTGVSLSAATTLSGTLNLYKGLLTTTATNLLTVSNATNTSGITGGNGTSYISGPVKWSIANVGNTDTKYSFPVGSSTAYLPLDLSVQSSATGSTATIQAVSSNPGGSKDASITTLDTTEYWTVATTGSTLTSLKASLGKASLGSYLVVAKAPSLTGAYTTKGGSSITVGGITGLGLSDTITNTPGTAGTYYLTLGIPCSNPPGIGSATAAASPICSSATTILTANSVTGGSAVVKWYSGSCGVGLLHTGTTDTVAPGTYYARVTATCGLPVETSVTVAAKTNAGITSATAAASSICSSATTTLTANGAVGTGASVTWYSGTGATGTNYGTGTSISKGPGTYYAYVSGDCGTAEASVTVNTTATPAITLQPIGASYLTNNVANPLTLTATGAGLTYQWYSSTDRTGSTTSYTSLGATTNTYTRPATATNGTTYYYAIVSGTCTPSVSSDTVAIDVSAPIYPSLDLTSAAGTDAQTVAEGTAITNITYSWGGNATTATITWSGTLNGSTAPTGISFDNTGSVTISGTPTVPGNYGYSLVTSGGSPAVTLTGTITVKLATPSISAASPITNTSFTANWSSVSNATSYDLLVYTSNNGTGTPSVVNVSGTSYSVTSLNEGTAYSYKVVAKASGIPSSDTSAYQAVTTYAPAVSVSAWVTGAGAFGNQVVNTTSAAQTFTVSGTHLDANIVITAPTGYSVSDGSGYGSSVTLNLNGSNAVSTTTIYVEHTPTSIVGTDNGNISLASTNTSTQNVAVTGASIATVPSATSTIYTGSTSASQTVLTLVLPGSGGGAKRIIIGKQGSSTTVTPVNNTAYTSQTVSSVAFTANQIASSGNYVIYNGTGSGPITVTGLAANTTYAFTIYEYNDNAGVGADYGTGNTTTMTSIAAGSVSSGNATWVMASTSANTATLDNTAFTSSNITASNITYSNMAATGSGSGHQKFGYTFPTTLATTNTMYVEYTIAPATGFVLTPTSASVDAYCDGTPVSIGMYYSTDGGSTFTQLKDQVLTTTATVYSGNVSGITTTASQTFKVRIYPYSSSGSSKTLRLANLIINGGIQTGGGGCTTPAVYTVGGGGTYCAGGTGVNITLNGSDASSVSYQAYNGATAFGTAVAGTSSALTMPNITSASGTTTYTVKATNTCGTTNMIGTAAVTVNALQTIALTSTTGTNAQTVCYNSAITNITYSVAGSATGSGVTGLPSGVTGSYSSGVFTISGSPSQSGTFPYTVTTTGSNSCTATATGSITVTALPTPTFVSGPATASINLNTLYATQSGKSNYVWSISGTAGIDYNVIDHGTSSDYYVTIMWLTTGTKSVSVNYTSSSCTAVSATVKNTTVNNNTNPPTLIAATHATVDAPFDVTFTPDNSTWRGTVSDITINGVSLDPSAYNVSGTGSGGKITLDPSFSALLDTARKVEIVVHSNSTFNAAVLDSQAIGSGVPDSIVIVTQPTAPATVGGVLVTQPVVALFDHYKNATTSATPVVVSISGTNTLSGTTSVAANAAGIVTYSGLGAASSAGTLTAATLKFKIGADSVISNSFNIPIYTTASTDQFRSKQTGSYSVSSTWQASHDGTNWYTATSSPDSSASSILIQNGHTVTVSSNSNANALNVANGGQLTLNATKTLTIKTGSTVSVSGYFLNSGTLILAKSATVASAIPAFTSTGTYEHNVISTAGDSIPKSTWASGSTCIISGMTNVAPGGWAAQAFSNLTWNCPNQTAAATLGTKPSTTISGTFTVASTGTDTLQLLASPLITLSPSNYVQTGGSVLLAKNQGSSGARTLNVSNSFSITGSSSVLYLQYNPNNSYTGQLNVGGDFTIGTGATITVKDGNTKNPVCNITLNGAGTTTQNITLNGNLTSAPTSKINFEINRSGTGTNILNSNCKIYNSTLKLTSGNLSIGAHTLTIDSTGSISYGTGKLVGSNSSNLVMNSKLANTLSFNASANDSLLNSLAIDSTGSVTLTGSLGITKLLSLNNIAGTLNTAGGHLSLKSTSISNTAELGKVAPGFVMTGGNITVERYIPVGLWEYEDLGTSGVLPTSGSKIFNQWQEGGVHSNFGIYITGANGTNAINASKGFDTAYNRSASMWNFTKNNWYDVKSTIDSALNATKGYRVFVRGDRNFTLYVKPYKSSGGNPINMYSAATIRTTGSLVTGDVNYTTSAIAINYGSAYQVNEPGITGGVGNWNLLSNPYACAVSWSSILNHNTSLYNTYYYLAKTAGGYNTYVTVKSFEGTITVSPNYASGNDTIQQGQAIWLINTTASPNFTISENDKIVGHNHTAVFDAKQQNMLSVTLSKNNLPLDGTVAMFSNKYATSIGDEDSRKLMNAGENIYINESKTGLSIDGLPVPTAKDIIALNLSNIKADTEYSMNVDASKFNADGLTAYIRDAVTSKDVLASEGIKFTPTSDAVATYTNRYSIVFKPATTPVTVITGTENKGTVSVYPNPVTEKVFALQTTNLSKGKYNVTIIDNLGKVVMTTVINHEVSSLNETIKMSSELPSGIYRVVVKNAVTGVNYENSIIAK